MVQRQIQGSRMVQAFGHIGACMLSHFSHAQLFVTPWTLVHQTPLSIEFSRQEYWSGLPFPSSEDLPDPGIEPVCVSYVSWISSGFFTTSATWLNISVWVVRDRVDGNSLSCEGLKRQKYKQQAQCPAYGQTSKPLVVSVTVQQGSGSWNDPSS